MDIYKKQKTFLIKDKKKIRSIPDDCGVYLFKDNSDNILYIGKANNLKKRIAYYFRKANIQAKTAVLVKHAHNLSYITTLSEFDAIILESKLIYKYQPKYNIIAKDDKTPLYILITTSCDLPQIKLIRKTDIAKYVNDINKDKIIGPFQSGHLAKNILRSIREVVPFCTRKVRNGKPCFYFQLGLCDPCPSYIEKVADIDAKKELVRKYRKNISKIVKILDAKSGSLIKTMEIEMRGSAQNQNYEKAVTIRNQISLLYEMMSKKYDPMIYIQSDNQIINIARTEIDSLKDALNPFFRNLNHLERIEAYDISNFQGNYATGSMVVLTNGIVDKSEYKRFKIKYTKGINDYQMLTEIIKRRFNHRSWRRPNLLVIDGGKGQLRSTVNSLNGLNIDIPVIGLAKRFEEIFILKNRNFGKIKLNFTDPGLHLLKRIRDEAHRFALTYHKKLRDKDFLEK